MTRAMGVLRSGSLGLERMLPRMLAERDFADPGEARRAIAAYEGFFRLAATGPEAPLVPSDAVDRVWRRHLLETPAYHRDCLRWAGGYLHRDRGHPPGGFERCRDRIGRSDPTVWDRPGTAFVHRGAVGPGAGADCGIEGLVGRGREALGTDPDAPRWVREARVLLATDPDAAVVEYVRFLRLLVAEPGVLTPCLLVDEFWHQHILDSRAYLRYCDRAAGRPLHHRPTYGLPRRVHRPRFARTKSCYRERFGVAPPLPTWSHMAESGGGGDGGDSSPPPPLYAIGTHDRVRAVLKAGRSNALFRRNLHRVLARKGVTPELWAGLIRAVNEIPRVNWRTAGRSRPELRSQRNLAIALICVCLVLAATWVTAMLLSLRPNPMPPAGGLVVFGVFGVMIWLGIRMVLDVDEEAARRVVDRFGPVFQGLGVTLALDPQPTGTAITVDATLSDAELIFWEDDGRIGADLYVIDRPERVRILLLLGSVNPRHRRTLHPVLTRLGLTLPEWGAFLDAAANPIRLSAQDYQAIQPNPALRSALRAALVTAALLLGLVSVSEPVDRRSPGPSVAGQLPGVVADAMIVGAVAYAIRWRRRPIDEKLTRMRIARFIPLFQERGITLEFVDDLGAVRVDAALAGSGPARPWEPDEKPTTASIEREEKEQQEADRKAAARRARQARRKERLRRRMERDESYRDRGIKPGPWAWFQVRSDLSQALIVGLGVGLPVALIVGAALLVLRR